MFIVFLLHVLQLHVDLFIRLFLLVMFIKDLLNLCKSATWMILYKNFSPFKNNIFEYTLEQIDNVIVISFFIGNDDTFGNFNMCIWFYIFYGNDFLVLWLDFSTAGCEK